VLASLELGQAELDELAGIMEARKRAKRKRNRATETVKDPVGYREQSKVRSRAWRTTMMEEFPEVVREKNKIRDVECKKKMEETEPEGYKARLAAAGKRYYDNNPEARVAAVKKS